MKRLVFILIILVLLPVYGFADDQVQASGYGYVTGINFMGTLWQNANRGGFYFYIDPMPPGVDYFIVRGNSELYIDRLLATLLSAKSMNKRIAVSYIVYNPANPYGIEGDIVSISIE
jgi:hypothetical protein